MVLRVNTRRFASRRSSPDGATVSVPTGDHKFQKPNRLGVDPFEKALHCAAPAKAIGVSPTNSKQPTSPKRSPTKSILREPSTKRPSEDDINLFDPVDFGKSRTDLSLSNSIKRKVSFGPDVKPGPNDACSSEMNAFLSSLLANIGKLECSAERLNAGLMNLSVGMKECAGASEGSRYDDTPEAVGEFALANQPLQRSKFDDPIVADRTLYQEMAPIDTRDTRESTKQNHHAGEREEATPKCSMVNSTRDYADSHDHSSDGIRVVGEQPQADPLRSSTNTPRATNASEAFASPDPTPTNSAPPKRSRSRFVMKKQRSVVEKNKSLDSRFSSKNRQSTKKTSGRRKKGKISNLVMTGLARPLKKPVQIISGGIKSQIRPRKRLVLTAK